MRGFIASRLTCFATLTGLALLMTGCAASGFSSNPLERSFTWFSYLGGDDIRASCSASPVERYRFVYNAEGEKQIRTYDIALEAGGGQSGIMESHVLTDVNLARLSVSDPLQPWRGEGERTILSGRDIATLREALVTSGFDRPAPRGAYLRSDDFYWTVSACRNGQFHFNAYSLEMPQFQAIRFDETLYRLDPLTRVVPVNPPRRLTLAPFPTAMADASIRSGGYASGPFMVQVARDGIGLQKGFF
ncbi:MAG: hypothetical protein KJ904_17785 [Alphaproteobacteria bacterium]|nr:hypothetical protein [Alphaproteobacteria bacterium]MBU0889009.1 hypothetical protein [Alphaproteobacteria bacterium]MBU1814029.1 hypothetical protein [Alphaproteobacteria bacterium]